MSRSSKNSSKTGAKYKGLERPFKESVVRKATKIVADYRIILERNERLGFIGSSVELPTVFADAKTPEKCYRVSRCSDGCDCDND